jgi:hypothetical protein
MFWAQYLLVDGQRSLKIGKRLGIVNRPGYYGGSDP